MAGKGGGAWKVAYADFVTAMMAFFMVMWLVGQKDSVKEGIAEYFRDPPDPFAVFEGHRGSRRSGQKKTKKSTDNVIVGPMEDAELRRSRGIQVRSSERSGIGAVVYFDEFSDTLTAAAKKELDDLVPKLIGKPQKVEIRGHATRRPLPEDSPYTDAWQLSYLRAATVRQYLEEHGIVDGRIRMSQASGFEPLTPRIEPEYQAKNPRVEIYLLNEIAEAAPGTGPSDPHGGHGHAADAHHDEGHEDAAHDADPYGDAAHAAKEKAKQSPEEQAAEKPKPAPAKPADAHGGGDAGGHGGGHGGGGHGGGHGEAKPPEPPKKKGPPPLYTPMRKPTPPKPPAPEKKSGGHH